MAELKGNKYGTHRVIEPKGVLTQAAWKIDNDMSKVYSNEIVCDVTSLNIDSASFTQISEACGGDEKKIGEMILGIVAERGKQQNPVTAEERQPPGHPQGYRPRGHRRQGHPVRVRSVCQDAR